MRCHLVIAKILRDLNIQESWKWNLGSCRISRINSLHVNFAWVERPKMKFQIVQIRVSCFRMKDQTVFSYKALSQNRG